jgi:hypothetical protein
VEKSSNSTKFLPLSQREGKGEDCPHSDALIEPLDQSKPTTSVSLSSQKEERAGVRRSQGRGGNSFDVRRSTFNVLCRNLKLVAERLGKLASHRVAGKRGKSMLVLKGHRKMLIIPPSLQDEACSQSKPATLWLANFRCRFATTKWFLQSTFNVRCFPLHRKSERKHKTVDWQTLELSLLKKH